MAGDARVEFPGRESWGVERVVLAQDAVGESCSSEGGRWRTIQTRGFQRSARTRELHERAVGREDEGLTEEEGEGAVVRQMALP